MRKRVWLGGGALALLLVYLVCPFRVGIVCGASMEPTFRNGQPILIDRGYYRRHPLTRGDVVLLRHEGQTLIKRVFACAGDAFHVLVFPDEEGVNRYVVDAQVVQRLRRAHARQVAAPVARVSRVCIPPGHIYVLGDNTSASVDSRDFGWVPVGSVIGHVSDRGSGARMGHGVRLAHLGPNRASPH
jgi:signal peptidase I